MCKLNKQSGEFHPNLPVITTLVIILPGDTEKFKKKQKQTNMCLQ